MLHVTRIITVDGCYNLEKKKKKKHNTKILVWKPTDFDKTQNIN